MTVAAFRRIALGMTGVVESSHMGHPDFRANGRIFASVHGRDRGMVKLLPEQQARLIAAHPDAFVAESGAWGRQGYTRVLLAHASEDVVGEAMTLAWQDAHAARSPRRAVRR